MNVQHERIVRLFTQRELAESLKVSIDTVKSWERKDNPIIPGLVNQRKLTIWMNDNPVMKEDADEKD